MDSNNVFPVLPGLKWDIMMTPIFETLVLLAQSGRETRTAQYYLSALPVFALI